MNAAQMVLYVVGSLCAAYALWNWAWLAMDEGYAVPGSQARNWTFWGGLSVLVAAAGGFIVALKVGETLVWWIPWDWMADDETPWRVRVGQGIGGMLGFATLAALTRRPLDHDIRHDINVWRRHAKFHGSDSQAKEHLLRLALDAEQERLEQQLRREAAQKQRASEWHEQTRIREKTDRENEARRKAGLRATVDERTSLLKLMTATELDAVWAARPLISWTSPMNEMTAAEQRNYWAENLLHTTDWEIPPELLAAAAARKISSKP